MKSIVRRDTGETWKAYVTRLMREEGVIEEDHELSDEEVRRYDKGRKDKKVSNDEGVSRPSCVRTVNTGASTMCSHSLFSFTPGRPGLIGLPALSFLAN